MQPMASRISLPVEKGKKEAFSQRSPLDTAPEAPPRTDSSARIQDGDIRCPSPRTLSQWTSALPAMESTCRSLIPYVPMIPVQQPISSNHKVIVNGSCMAAPEIGLDVQEDKKREKEHKKRSKNWTRLETLKLIKIRSHLAPRFAKTGRKSELWDEIAEELQSRDAQQCRDKWEKLMAGYKEVRDGLKEREDNPFFDELHSLLSGGSSGKDRENGSNSFRHEIAIESPTQRRDSAGELNSNGTVKDEERYSAPKASMWFEGTAAEQDAALEESTPVRKRKRGSKFVAVTDLHAVRMLLETIISRQQHFFKELLDAMEQREQLREQIRQEREDKWRAEERAQRCMLNNTMLVLTQRLVGERGATTVTGPSGSLVSSPTGHEVPKKRSKNWKRGEVLQLIKLRGEMESRFAKSTRRAALWDEIAESLGDQGVTRDGKQCREKWDKLMSEFKDVRDGKREEGDSPYFTELTAVVGRKPGDAG
eukprot:c28284_g2_i1 orf=942-2378(+)